MLQQYQKLQNHNHEVQRHHDQLLHHHKSCHQEPPCEDSKHYLTSTHIGHRFIPAPPPLPSERVYLPGKFNEETDPRVKILPFETTSKLHHDRKIIERNPSEHYNLENIVECHRNPAVVEVRSEPARPFTSSEYADSYRDKIPEDVSGRRPDQCEDSFQSMISDTGLQHFKTEGPVDVMCDVTTSNGAVMKLLHPYISVYDFDFEYPDVDSPFCQYRRQVLNNYQSNKEFYSPFLKTAPSALCQIMNLYGKTRHQPEQNLNNPDFGALQIVPKRLQHVPNFSFVSETRAMYVDPRRMLDKTYRKIIS